MVVENQARATDLARAFVDALNARDAGALARLADEQIELTNPIGGRSLRGGEGLGVKETAGGELHGTAGFEVRGDKIAAFEIESELLRGRGRASR